LLDRNVANQIGGPHFNFQPYDYGPFDAAVYRELEVLQRKGLVNIANYGSRRTYELTAAGQRAGEGVLGTMPGELSNYIAQVATWVRRLSFAQLVGSIYQQYPEMRANRGLSDILCVRPVSSLSHEALAKDDGELGSGLDPLARRSFPFLGRVVENQI